MSQKTFNAMKKLATFYNPMATNLIQDTQSDDDTVVTSHQLGRVDAAEDAISDSDASSKTHGLKEDCFPSREDLASATIDYLPNFAFHIRNQVLTPATTEHSLNFMRKI